MIFLEEYALNVLNGDIKACDPIKIIYEKLLDKYKNPNKYAPYVYDINFGNRPIHFIEKFCKQSQGDLGADLKLALFQKAKMNAVFGFVHEETAKRQYLEVFDVRGRKNGKTTESAGTALYMALGDGEGAPLIYFGATSKEQAKIMEKQVRDMIEMSPDLRKLIKSSVGGLSIPCNLGMISTIASDVKRLDGKIPHFVTLDEVAAIPKGRDNIYALMQQAMSSKSRTQPLLYCISTNGYERDSLFDNKYKYSKGVLSGEFKDERFLPIIYELDNKSEIHKPHLWIKANPGLGIIKDFEKLEINYNKGMNDPSYFPDLLTKDFNLIENSATRWLKWDTLNNPEKIPEDAKFKYCIGGIDAADSVDLSAAVALCMRKGDDKIYVKSMFWLPETTFAEIKASRKQRDGVNYIDWVNRGLLRICEGNVVDKRVFLEWFRELRQKEKIYTYKVGYDPNRIDDSLREKFKLEFGAESFIHIPQNTAHLSQPMKDMLPEFEVKKFNYDNNDILKWCLSNVEIKIDSNGDWKPIKGVDKTKRIDGFAAMLCAYITLKNNMNSYKNLM